MRHTFSEFLYFPFTTLFLRLFSWHRSHFYPVARTPIILGMIGLNIVQNTSRQTSLSGISLIKESLLII